jgi:signal transduction histidine kinase
VAFALFALVTLVRFASDNPAETVTLFYVVPVAVVAVAGGGVAGLLAAAFALALVVLWARLEDVPLTAIDYLSRAATFAFVGGLVGFFADRSRRALREVRRREEDLQRSNADLERFAYVASHDLAEPLRTISGFATLLTRRYRGRLDDDADEFLGFIEDGTRRMQELIRALLDLSRAGRSTREPERVELDEALADVVRTLRARIEETGARVSAQDLPAITGDPVQLRQLLQNLVANALKFRGEQPAEVEVWARRRDGEVQVTVADRGIGIAPDQAERIFEPFQRAASGYDGAGIGLAVCARIVASHGGRIWAEPRPGGGSLFTFALPE